MRYSFIKDNYGQFPTRVMCNVLRVSPSGYYHWRNRPPSPRAVRHSQVLADIRRVHSDKSEIYGYRRIHEQLLADGVDCSESVVYHLMRKNGIRAKRKHRFVTTTDSKHCLPISPNLLERNFEVTGLPPECRTGRFMRLVPRVRTALGTGSPASNAASACCRTLRYTGRYPSLPLLWSGSAANMSAPS